jgi:hypothetical protein
MRQRADSCQDHLSARRVNGVDCGVVTGTEGGIANFASNAASPRPGNLSV